MYPSTAHSRKRTYTTDSPAQTYYTPYAHRMAPSSSPPRSSSPPMTPYSIRHARSDALIRSSPEIASDTLFHSVRDHMEDPSFAWAHRSSSHGYAERAYAPLKHDYFSSHNYPPPSDFDVSEYSEDMNHDVPDVDSGHTSDSAPVRNSVFFSDSEEENHGNDEFTFEHSGYRTTFFRTSAERGQWKSHPIPFKSTPLPQAQRSASIPSRLPTPVLVDSTRTNSEPAPSTVIGLGFSVQLDQYDDLPGTDGGSLPNSFENVAESELQPEAESPHTMPSLASDWESIPDIDVDAHEYDRPSSPLPPSSPMSYSESILSRSVSLASSPMIRSSSPLSEISSLDQEERNGDDMEDLEVKIRSSVSTPTFTLDPDITSENTPDEDLAATSTMPALKSASPTLSVDAAVVLGLQVLEPFNAPDITTEATDAVPSPDSSAVNPRIDLMEDQSYLSGITHAERGKLAQAIQEDVSTQTKVEDDNDKKHAAKRKRRKGNDEDKHPIPKKRAKVGRVADLLRPMTHNSDLNEKTGSQVEREKDDKDPCQEVSIIPKRLRKGEVEVSVSCPASSTKRGKPHRLPLPKASSSHSHMTRVDGNDTDCRQRPNNTQDPETTALNTEICGMLIETMALSRASSLPLSSLYKMMMQTQPSLKSQRSEQEWLTLFAQVLQEGEAERGSGVFGKVESSGKDESNRPLEAQWFYVPEQDEDQDRAALIRSMMPRPAKRTETKKYKQYYWRPLDKISKWDPEDEL